MKTIDSTMSVVDPVVAEVRRHKQEIADVFGFDVMALGRSLQQREVGDSRFRVPADEQDGSEKPTDCSELKGPGVVS